MTIVGHALSKIVRGGVSQILLGSLVGQGSVLLTAPILSRLYGPDDFGLLSVVTGVSALLGAVVTLGLERAIPLPRNRSQVDALVVAATIAALAGAVITAVGVFLLRDSLAEWFHAQAFRTLWWLVPVSVTAIGVQRIVAAMLVRRRAYRSLAIRNGAQGVTQVVVNGLGAAAGPVGLLLGPPIGRLVGAAGAVRLGRGRRRLPGRNVVVGVVREHRRFVWFAPGSALLNVAGQQAPFLVIAALHGSATVGLLALTMRVVATPVGILTDAVSQWFTGVFAQRAREQRPLRVLVSATTLRLAGLAVVLLIALVVAAPPTFEFVFGREWRAAGDYAQLVAPVLALQIVVSPVSQALAVLHRQGTQLVWDACRAVVVVGGTAIAAITWGSPAVTVAVFASLGATAYIVLWCVVACSARRHDSEHHARYTCNI